MAFHGIVESDDAAGAGKAAHVQQDVTPVQAGGVVTGDEVPHHDLVAPLDKDILVPLHPSVRRSEEVGVQILIRFVHVVEIGGDAVAKSADVVERVVAEAVSSGFDHLKDLGMLPNVVADHEEGGFDAIFVEHVQHPWRDLGNGTVVKREIDSLFLSVHAPQGVWIKPTQENCGLLDNHAVGLKEVFYKLWNKERSKESAYVLVAESF